MIRIILKIGEAYFIIWGLLRILEIIYRNFGIDKELTNEFDRFVENIFSNIKDDLIRRFRT